MRCHQAHGRMLNIVNFLPAARRYSHKLMLLVDAVLAELAAFRVRPDRFAVQRCALAADVLAALREHARPERACSPEVMPPTKLCQLQRRCQPLPGAVMPQCRTHAVPCCLGFGCSSPSAEPAGRMRALVQCPSAACLACSGVCSEVHIGNRARRVTRVARATVSRPPSHTLTTPTSSRTARPSTRPACCWRRGGGMSRSTRRLSGRSPQTI